MTSQVVSAAAIKKAQTHINKRKEYAPVLVALSKRDRSRGDINVSTFAANAARTHGVPDISTEAAHEVFQILKGAGIGHVYRDAKAHVKFLCYVDILDLANLLLGKKDSQGRVLDKMVENDDCIPYVSRRMNPGEIRRTEAATNVEANSIVSALDDFFKSVDLSALATTLGSDNFKKLMNIYAKVK